MPHPDGEKHHYIPKFYLKRWAAVDGRVTEYSRPFKKVEPKWVHPDGTGYERGLYAIPGMSPELTNLVEQKYLKPADNLASTTLDDLIAGTAFRKAAEMRRDWSRFIFSLLMRFPEAQKALREDLAESVKQQTMAAGESRRGIKENNGQQRPKRGDCKGFSRLTQKFTGDGENLADELGSHKTEAAKEHVSDI